MAQQLRRLAKLGRDGGEGSRIAINTMWLMGDSILRLTLGLIIGVLIARHLGPESYGLFSFALALVTLIAAASNLGLHQIAVRHFVEAPWNAHGTLATVLALQAVGGIAGFTLLIALGIVLRGDDTASLAILAILGASLLLNFGMVSTYWFESRVESRYTVVARGSALLLFSAIRLGLLATEAPLHAFVWAYLGESVTATMLSMATLIRLGPTSRVTRPLFADALKMLSQSWPLAISAVAVSGYMKMDQIMLGQMIGLREVGIYSVAVRLSEAWLFVPVAISASVLPMIIRSFQHDTSRFQELMQTLCDVLAILAIAVALTLTFGAHQLVELLFGPEYAPASAVVVVHAWAGVFAALIVARGKWLLVTRLQHMTYKFTVIGLVLNLVLNFVLIPIYGGVGSAIATLISQGVVALAVPALFDATRPSSLMLLKALNPFRWAQLAKPRAKG